ncbi:methylamine utilization protein MauJ [Burkholderia gladioli]|uniref:methylamine utilization protein MauJ n=1 Tax=Burkholderia gladioli TaxID=28095 RepID=UPI00163ED32F|nr:methylamine utilization protein MauJ [Burkholderia gladioli]
MKTPYVPHWFGIAALDRINGRRGWLSVGVASSIAWSQDDVWIEYDGHEYFLQGVKREQEGEVRSAPGISTPAERDQMDEAMARLYRFTSILGFYKRGYVDITSRTWGTSIIRHGAIRDAYTEVTHGVAHGFDCNHMPIIEDDQVRKALAFLREGRRLSRVHDAYSFLSFFKVVESQMPSEQRVEWVGKNLDQLTEERVVNRIKELRDQGIDVNRHLFDSGRCAVAHASIGKVIVDPDIPADRQRIAADLCIIEALANRYIKVDAGVPDEMDLYSNRDRVAPLYPLMRPESVETLKAGGAVEAAAQLGQLEGATVSVNLWPHPPADQFREMTLLPIDSGDGVLRFVTLSSRGTIVLAFAMDVANGKLHTLLNESGLRQGAEIAEQDIEDFTRYFHSVIANGKVELRVKGGVEPVDCEVVIPVNIIPQAPEEAVQRALEQFRRSRS